MVVDEGLEFGVDGLGGWGPGSYEYEVGEVVAPFARGTVPGVEAEEVVEGVEAAVPHPWEVGAE